MHPIHRYHQSEHIQTAADLPLAVAVFGRYETVQSVGLPRLVDDVESGRWDAEIKATSCGLEDRSLLLTFLGSRWSVMVAEYGKEDRDGDVARLARAMVDRGANPLAKDAAGRDGLDQAFAVGEASLVAEWIKLLPSISDAQARICEGGPQNTPPLPWLHQAARAGNDEMVKTLLACGVDPNQVNDHNETALFWASSPGVASLLVQGGCDPLHRNDERQDAKVFWSSSRRLPQSEVGPMVATLPKPAAGKVSRELMVDDFYTQAMTAGKGALVPMLARLRLQPGEVDSGGFGLLGNLGSRLLWNVSSINQVETNKTVKWAVHLLSDPALRAQATEQDWQRLWLGACRFGLHRLDGVNFRPPQAADIEFCRNCMGQIPKLAADMTEMQSQDMALSASHELIDIAKGLKGEDAPVLASLAASCLALAGNWQGSHNSRGFAHQQAAFLQHMRANPQWELERDSGVWQVALVVDSAHQTIQQKNPRLDVELLNHLRDAGTPFPDNMSTLLNNAMQVLTGSEQEVLADLHAQLISSQTLSIGRHASSRPRL